MHLTPAQAAALHAAASAELRSQRQMLSLLLAEGLRFYFNDREPQRGGSFNESELIDELIDELLTSCQLADMEAQK
jgi:hypothetical protein